MLNLEGEVMKDNSKPNVTTDTSILSSFQPFDTSNNSEVDEVII